MSSTDDTLGGYLRMHSRPPAFKGTDGHPYTVSLEVEKTGDPRAPFQGYLVFPRWAETGLGIIGHVESPTLCRCRSSEEAESELGRLSLADVKRILDDAVAGSGNHDPSTS